jgi:hypothetical protein
MAQSESIDRHFKKIHERVETIIVMLDDLLEDPVFLDTINGEQELSLDLTLELLDGISMKFEPDAPQSESFPIVKDDSYDAD